MHTDIAKTLERHLPKLLGIANFLIGRERGSEELMEDWLSTVLESKSASDFVSLSDAHLFSSCCVFLLMSDASLDIKDINYRIEVTISEIAKITHSTAQDIRRILMPARQSLRNWT